jgi:hypothetical protein
MDIVLGLLMALNVLFKVIATIDINEEGIQYLETTNLKL